MGTDKILKISHLGKTFKNKVVLSDISLELTSGEIVGLIGQNGSGKTTLMKLISHLLLIEDGNIECCGYDIAMHYEKALGNMGVMLSDKILVDRLSGYDNLKMRGCSCNKIQQEQMLKIAQTFGVEHYWKKKCGEYSLGMRQKLCLAIACLAEPKLLVLDEPMNGLDPEGVQELVELLKKLAKDYGVTVLISSHLLYDIENLCNRVIIMQHGKIIGEESISELQAKGESVSEAYFRRTEENNEVANVDSK